jgi:hypothetical protein
MNTPLSAIAFLSFCLMTSFTPLCKGQYLGGGSLGGFNNEGNIGVNFNGNGTFIQNEYRYTITGGRISGSLNGVQFNNATYQISATSGLKSYLLGTAWNNAPYSAFYVTPSITITTENGSETANLLPTDGLDWIISSSENKGANISTHTVNYFTNCETAFELSDGPTNVNEVRGFFQFSFNNPMWSQGSTLSYDGIQMMADNWTVNTSVGELTISSFDNQTSNFSIIAVPEPPSFYSVLFLLALMALFFAYRRLAAQPALAAKDNTATCNNFR